MTIWMLHTTTKWLEICIDINIALSEVDHYTWLFTSRIFRLPLEIIFLLNKYFFLLMKTYNEAAHEGGVGTDGPHAQIKF